MVTINIGRKEAIYFSSVIIVFLAIGLSIAHGGSNPEVMGHSIGELEMPGCDTGEAIVKQEDGSWGCGSITTTSTGGDVPDCSNDQILRWSGIEWNCSNVPINIQPTIATTSCQYGIKQISGSTVTCASAPAVTLCTWEGRTYSTGATCTSSESCGSLCSGVLETCLSSGAWRSSTYSGRAGSSTPSAC